MIDMTKVSLSIAKKEGMTMYRYVVRYKDFDGTHVYFTGFSSMPPVYDKYRGRNRFAPIVTDKPTLKLDITTAKMVRDLTGGKGEVVAVNKDGVIIG